MKCNYNIDDIIKYTENVLPEETASKLAEHINTCEKCNSMYASLVFTEKFSTIEAAADKNFHINILNSIDRNRYRKNKTLYYWGSKLSKYHTFMKPAAVAACLIILLSAALFIQPFKGLAGQAMNAVGSILNSKDRKDDSILIKENESIEVIDKDKVRNRSFITAVTKECTGKNGPGSEYKDTVRLPYGRLVSVVGWHEENFMWLLAEPILEPDDKNSKSSAKTQFWINTEEIDIAADFSVSFDNCSLSDALKFTHIVENTSVDASLKLLPQNDSADVAEIENGDLICVLRQDNGWSLVRKIADGNMADLSDTGWIKNTDYTYCKKGTPTNQGFILSNTRLYDMPDEESVHDQPFVFEGPIAPVTVKERNGEWIRVIDSPNGILAWVKSSDLIASFEGIDPYTFINPPIDKSDLTSKILKEIINWDNITLFAIDIDKQVTLTKNQKHLLAKSLIVEDIEFFDGGISSEREAIYPYYSLEFIGSTAASKGVKPASSYKFVVAGDDRLVVFIPPERYNYYGFNSEMIPVRFIKVNKEFINQIRLIIPTPSVKDKNSVNYLLGAEKVIVYAQGIPGEEGTGPQVYKCARAIGKYLRNEISGKEVPKEAESILKFEFIFKNKDTVFVEVTNRYILFNGRYYNLMYEAERLPQELFTGYF